MLRSLRAFTWLRWRLLVNGLEAKRRRGSLEEFSRILAVLLKAFALVLTLAAAAAAGLVGLWTGWRVAHDGLPIQPTALVARAVLVGVLAMAVLAPLLRSEVVSTISPRMLLLPIPRRALHLVEVAAAATDPWMAFVAPGALALGLGLLLGGRFAGGLAVVAAAVGIVATLATLSSLVSLSMHWLMRNRRRGESATLIIVLAISVLSLVPVLLTERLEQRTQAVEGRRSAPQAPISRRLDASLPAWTQALPSELYGRSLAAAVDGRQSRAWLGVLALWAQAALCYALSARVHGRVLGALEGGASRRRTRAVHGGFPRLPGLSTAASAVALVQARTALRTVRGRLVVLLPGPMFALVGLVTRRIPNEFPGGDALGTHGPLLLGVQALFSLYALLAFSMNQFASDRAGLTLQMLTPLRPVDLVRGKAVGCGLVYAAQVGLSLLCAVAVTRSGSPSEWVGVLLGAFAVYALMSPLGALMSAMFPVASDLRDTSSKGSAHGVATLVGTAAAAVGSAPTALALLFVHHGAERPGLALLLTAAWTALALVAAALLLPLAAGPIPRLREHLLLVAQGR